jgi:hypothetical protein
VVPRSEDWVEPADLGVGVSPAALSFVLRYPCSLSPLLSTLRSPCPRSRCRQDIG